MKVKFTCDTVMVKIYVEQVTFKQTVSVNKRMNLEGVFIVLIGPSTLFKG